MVKLTVYQKWFRSTFRVLEEYYLIIFRLLFIFIVIFIINFKLKIENLVFLFIQLLTITYQIPFIQLSIFLILFHFMKHLDLLLVMIII